MVDLFMPGLDNISFKTTEAVFDFIDKNIGDDKIVGDDMKKLDDENWK